MILIAESGSTKCDWSLIVDGKLEKEYTTKGINPYFNTTAQIHAYVNENLLLKSISGQVTYIHFFGSGCSSQEKQDFVKASLSADFPNSKIVVGHDLLGAALSTYAGEPAITAILGTGSNVCLFDGSKLTQIKPSLGYIMGDEGGGVYFGKN